MPKLTILDLSTAHITYKDSLILARYPAKGNRPKGASVIAYPYEYGWTVSTSVFDGDPGDHDGVRARMATEGFSEHFIAVLTKAHAERCVMVRLDMDGEPKPGLPTFDWESEKVSDVAPEADETNQHIFASPS